MRAPLTDMPLALQRLLAQLSDGFDRGE